MVTGPETTEAPLVRGAPGRLLSHPWEDPNPDRAFVLASHIPVPPLSGPRCITPFVAGTSWCGCGAWRMEVAPRP